MNDDLVPEMHDLFKLTKYGHLDTTEKLEDFQKFKDYVPDNETWQGIINHHFFEDIVNFPKTPDVFILSIADHLASGIARERERRIGDTYSVYKLWNPIKMEIDPRLQNNSEIIELLEFVNRNPSKDDYFNKYDALLKTRTEDAGKGKNITSLYTHSLLTGKFYRILKKSPVYVIDVKDLHNDKSEVRNIQKKKENQEWKMYVIRCRIKFKQRPLRTKDLNIFSFIMQLFDNLQQTYSDNIFFSSSDELIMFFPNENDAQPMVQDILNLGFYLDVVYETRPLDDITDPRWIKENREKQTRWPKLSEFIDPPICQICQMAKATKHWPIDYILESKDVCDNCKKLITETSIENAFENLCEVDGGKLWEVKEDRAVEDLCDDCYRIRAQGIRLLKLKEWSEAGNTKVLWTRLSLDFDQLNLTLNVLYQDYLNSLNISDSTAQIRFPVISEFQQDYDKFLISFKRNIVDSFNKENVEYINDDMFCIKIDKLQDILAILKIYNNNINEFFPEFRKTSSSPIRLSLVTADSKYPFFEVWDIIENGKEDILVALIGRGQMKTTLSNLETLTTIYDKGYEFKKSALEKLARIAEISERLAQLTAQDKSDKDYQTYEQMTHLGLDFQSLLTFAKIMEDR